MRNKFNAMYCCNTFVDITFAGITLAGNIFAWNIARKASNT